MAARNPHLLKLIKENKVISIAVALFVIYIVLTVYAADSVALDKYKFERARVRIRTPPEPRFSPA